MPHQWIITDCTLGFHIRSGVMVSGLVDIIFSMIFIVRLPSTDIITSDLFRIISVTNVMLMGEDPGNNDYLLGLIRRRGLLGQLQWALVSLGIGDLIR
jgi:hypothetical protein